MMRILLRVRTPSPRGDFERSPKNVLFTQAKTDDIRNTKQVATEARLKVEYYSEVQFLILQVDPNIILGSQRGHYHHGSPTSMWINQSRVHDVPDPRKWL